MKTIYTFQCWSIQKDGETYNIYKGKKLIDSESDFDEAYGLLHQHKRTSKC